MLIISMISLIFGTVTALPISYPVWRLPQWSTREAKITRLNLFLALLNLPKNRRYDEFFFVS